MAERTQPEAVLARLRTGSLTQEQARDELGVWRLSAVILLLKRRGHNIGSESINVRSRYGNAAVSRYTLYPEGRLF